MPLIRNKKPIDVAFDSWICQYPESFHPADQERFYCLVKTVIAHSRSEQTRDPTWLRKKINEARHNLSEENIDHFCSEFSGLQEFYKTKPIPLIEIK